MGQPKRGFEKGELQEESMSSTDETHFTVNIDYRKRFGVSGENEVRYAAVTSGEEDMTMLACLSGEPNA